MARMNRLCAFAALSLLLPLQALAQAPNIVLIVSDDHGTDLGAYGNAVISTPNLDALAGEGLVFERAFAAQAICSPSRSSILTGVNPLRHGAHRNHSAIRPGIRTLPDYMQSLGYRVALAGKTHFGPIEQFPFEYLAQRPNGESDSATFIAKYFESIRRFISASEQPFMLLVNSNFPHSLGGEDGGFPTPTHYQPEDVNVPGYMVDTPETRLALAGYYELVSALDKDIGTLIKLVDQSSSAANTAVIYTSDHGAGFAFEKWTNYNAGLHVPLIVRYPNVVKPGIRASALVSLMDILPTVMELAGSQAPPDLDGKSFAAVLSDPSLEHHRYVYATHTTLGIRNSTDAFPIRSIRSDRYHYIQNLNPSGEFTNNITKKGQGGWFSWLEKARSDEFASERVRWYQKRTAEEFYDLQLDPNELNNVVLNDAYAELVSTHRQALEQWRHSQQDLGVNHPSTETILLETFWHAFKDKVGFWFHKVFG